MFHCRYHNIIELLPCCRYMFIYLHMPWIPPLYFGCSFSNCVHTSQKSSETGTTFDMVSEKTIMCSAFTPYFIKLEMRSFARHIDVSALHAKINRCNSFKTIPVSQHYITPLFQWHICGYILKLALSLQASTQNRFPTHSNLNCRMICSSKELTVSSNRKTCQGVKFLDRSFEV